MEEQSKIVIFKLGTQAYGFPITKVKEIIKMQDIYCIQQAPKYVEGMINIRGEIHIIYNMRKKFDMKEKAFDENNKIVLVNGKNVGFIVDEVSEIIQIQEEDIETISKMPLELRGNFIQSIAKINGNIIAILNLDTMMDSQGENT